MLGVRTPRGSSQGKYLDSFSLRLICMTVCGFCAWCKRIFVKFWTWMRNCRSMMISQHWCIWFSDLCVAWFWIWGCPKAEKHLSKAFDIANLIRFFNIFSPPLPLGLQFYISLTAVRASKDHDQLPISFVLLDNNCSLCMMESFLGAPLLELWQGSQHARRTPIFCISLECLGRFKCRQIYPCNCK